MLLFNVTQCVNIIITKSIIHYLPITATSLLTVNNCLVLISVYNGKVKFVVLFGTLRYCNFCNVVKCCFFLTISLSFLTANVSCENLTLARQIYVF